MGKFWNTLKSIGSTLGGPILGMVTGKMTGDYENERQLEQQKKLQDLQIKGQMAMGKYNQGLALDMWEKTNYAAQRKQLEKAGLNPGLMYGQAGAGGTTITPVGQTQGATAEGAQPIGMAMQLGLQASLQKAQIENIKAQTENTKVETAKTAGVDTENIAANTRLTNLASELKDKTMKEAIEIVQNELQKSFGEARSAIAKGYTEEQTYNEKIQQIRLDTEIKGVQLLAEKAGLIKTGAETEQIKNAIQMLQQQTAINWEKLSVEQREVAVKEAVSKFITSDAAQIKQWTSILTDIISVKGK